MFLLFLSFTGLIAQQSSLTRFEAEVKTFERADSLNPVALELPVAGHGDLAPFGTLAPAVDVEVPVDAVIFVGAGEVDALGLLGVGG